MTLKTISLAWHTHTHTLLKPVAFVFVRTQIDVDELKRREKYAEYLILFNIKKICFFIFASEMSMGFSHIRRSTQTIFFILFPVFSCFCSVANSFAHPLLLFLFPYLSLSHTLSVLLFQAPFYHFPRTDS